MARQELGCTPAICLVFRMMRQGKQIQKQTSPSEEKGIAVNNAFSAGCQDRMVANL
jgi:hypothetical protein